MKVPSRCTAADAAVHLDGTFIGLADAAEQTQKSRFAGAVRADHAYSGACLDGEIDFAQAQKYSGPPRRHPRATTSWKVQGRCGSYRRNRFPN